MDIADAVIEAKQALSGLTNRQRELSLMRARGMTNPEVAACLHLSEATVKAHLYTVFKHLRIENVTQLAVLCTLAGEITDWKSAA